MRANSIFSIAAMPIAALIVALLMPAAKAIGFDENTDVRIALWKTITTFDPVYATTGEHSIFFGSLFDGLVTRSGDEIVGADAEYWKVSEDGKTYTFFLRDGATWSDGNPVIAKDYELAFRRVVDSSLKEAPRPSYLLSVVKNAGKVKTGEVPVEALGVRAIDNKTLEIELEAPASYFLEILNYKGLVPIPSHIYKTHGNDWWKQTPLVSNGPYYMLSNTKGQHIILEKRQGQATPDAPEHVHLILVESRDGAMLKVIKNEIDLVFDVRIAEISWLNDRMGFNRWDVARPSTIYATFNTRSEKLADKRVRNALTLAIDREAIARATQMMAAISFAPDSMLGTAINNLVDENKELPREQRIIKARALLAEAGYGPENPLTITLMKVRRQVLGATIIAMQAMFEQIGVKVEIEEIQQDDFSPRLASKNYEVSAADWMADYDDAMTFYGILQSGASKNHSAFNNAEFDALIKEALVTQDLKVRQKIYAKLENILTQETPIVPLIHTSHTIIAHPRLESIGSGFSLLISPKNIRISKSQTSSIPAPKTGK